MFARSNYAQAFGEQPEGGILVFNKLGPRHLQLDEHCVSDAFRRVGWITRHFSLHRLLALPMVAELAGASMPLAGEGA